MRRCGPTPTIRRSISGSLMFLILLTWALTAVPLLEAQTYTVLHDFTAWADGFDPEASLIVDAAGNLYGTTYEGGAGLTGGCPAQPGCGIVFKLDPSGVETVIPFIGANGQGPYANVIRDSAGNLYGTTYNGGSSGDGVIFSIDTTNTITVLHSFSGKDGGLPSAGLLRDSSGNLYGTTTRGGKSGQGVVFRLDPQGHETTLYSFTGGADGGQPQSDLVRDSEGNLYGATLVGGLSNHACLTGTCGVVFKLDRSRTLSVLYSFTGGPDGGNPNGVVIDQAGNLYGSTYGGGIVNNICVRYGCGVVFKLDQSGNQSVLHTFTGGADGGFPSPVIRDSAGNLYGTTSTEGTEGGGVVFELDPSGNETVLYSSTVGFPGSGLVRDSRGNLYGTAYGGITGGICNLGGCGVVFKLAPAQQ